MIKKYLYTFLTIITLIFCVSMLKEKDTFSQNINTKQTTEKFDFNKFKPSSSSTVYDKQYYSLEYNEKHEQANWVYYLLTSEFVYGNAIRKNNFRQDYKIKTKSANLSDYKRSGYSRGHLCPAADMKINNFAMSETFLLSNMSPQLSEFNGGQWNNLEMKVRDWAVKEDSIIVVTGPIFKNNLGKIGVNSVTVPGAYYKVIYDLTPPQKMTAFILPHQKKLKHFMNYQTSVNKVEQETGIDFFSVLDDNIEEKLEANISW